MSKKEKLKKNLTPQQYHITQEDGTEPAFKTEYWDNKTAHDIARNAINKNKILAAICIAPVTLANAGVLEGKKATVWKDVVDKLKAKGVNYTGSDVEIDGKIITGNGPDAAQKFGEALVAALK